MSRSEHDEALERFAADPSTWGEPTGVLTGAAAAAHGRALMEAAGVDVAALERGRGRPRLGGQAGPKGVRSPRVNVAVDDDTDTAIERVRAARGMSRSDLVRAALHDYLAQAG